jgi:hypothetical protein
VLAELICGRLRVMQELLLKEVKVDPSEITEADWWDHADISINKPQVPNARVTVHSVPSQHV